MNLKKRRMFLECSCTTQQPDTATRHSNPEYSENEITFQEFRECSENFLKL